MKLTVENLSALKRENPESFYQLSAVMSLHVLLCGDSKLKGDIMNTTMPLKAVSCGDNAVASNEPLNSWVSRIKLFIRGSFKACENVVLFAGLTLQDAIYRLYTRTLEPQIDAAVFSEFETIEDAITHQSRQAEKGEQIKQVHIILAECPQLRELQAAVNSKSQEAPSYEYTDCEAFINDEIYTMLEKCDKLIHNNTVTH